MSDVVAPCGCLLSGYDGECSHGYELRYLPQSVNASRLREESEQKWSARLRAQRLESALEELHAAVREERRWATGTPEHTAAMDALYSLVPDDWIIDDKPLRR